MQELQPKRVETETSEAGTERLRAWLDSTERQVRDDAASVLTPGQPKTPDEEVAVHKLVHALWRPDLRQIQGAAGSKGP